MGCIITGEVIPGNRIGRRIGFPTANISLPDSDPAGDGVWAGTVTVEGTVYAAMINIGRNPTVGENVSRRLEAHLFGFKGDLYGKTIETELLEFIRPERKFGSLDELQRQIAEDKAAIEAYFKDSRIEKK